MTAITMPAARRINPMLPLVLLALIALAVLAIGVITQAHATQRHGSDAQAVRRCLNNNGPLMVFKHTSDSIWYLLCRLDNGKFGVQAVTKNGFEKTSFIPRDGSYSQVIKYLEQFSTKFRGSLPWK